MINTLDGKKQQFNSECEVINLKYEYPGYTGKEVYGIATNLSESILSAKYKELLEKYKPYIILSEDFVEERKRYRRNEKKHFMRRIRSEQIYALDDNSVVHHPELQVSDFVESLYSENNELKFLITQAMDKLTDTQKRRIKKHFFDGVSVLQIAKDEGKNDKTITESIEAGLKKLKKILKTPPNLSSPSGNK